jgi:hypothetical protein
MDGGRTVVKRRVSMWFAIRGVVMTVAMFALVLMVAVLHTVAGHGDASVAGTVVSQDSVASDAGAVPVSVSAAGAEIAVSWAASVNCPADGPSCMAVLTQSSVSVALHLTAVAALPAMTVACYSARLVNRSPLVTEFGLSILQGFVLRI